MVCLLGVALDVLRMFCTVLRGFVWPVSAIRASLSSLSA